MKRSAKLRRMVCVVTAALLIMFAVGAHAKKKARFYDFSDQLINGEIKKPVTLYMESRTRAKFAKLLRLKRSFAGALILSAQDPLLK